jgi:hypothetical protein
MTVEKKKLCSYGTSIIFGLTELNPLAEANWNKLWRLVSFELLAVTK